MHLAERIGVIEGADDDDDDEEDDDEEDDDEEDDDEEDDDKEDDDEDSDEDDGDEDSDDLVDEEPPSPIKPTIITPTKPTKPTIITPPQLIASKASLGGKLIDIIDAKFCDIGETCLGQRFGEGRIWELWDKGNSRCRFGTYSLSRLILEKHQEALVFIKHISTKNAHSFQLTLSICMLK